jgi:hypothetical protein
MAKYQHIGKRERPRRPSICRDRATAPAYHRRKMTRPPTNAASTTRRPSLVVSAPTVRPIWSRSSKVERQSRLRPTASPRLKRLLVASGDGARVKVVGGSWQAKIKEPRPPL